MFIVLTHQDREHGPSSAVASFQFSTEGDNGFERPEWLKKTTCHEIFGQLVVYKKFLYYNVK